ncbi:alpha/beta fold hydrolase [Paracoccus pacificus]|uniref:Alpha/beta fold hydrolase n=1 Tax=Paracoccus pacificus TaxID=1463598 RepID=A0ABW4R1T2_9RHOB
MSLGRFLARVVVASVAATALADYVLPRVIPRPGRLVRVGGRNIHVLTRGDGPPVLLIHGLGGQLGNFYALIDELVAPGFRVIAYDRAAAGDSDPAPPEQAHVDAQAILAAAVLRSTTDRPALVIGHSLGGAVALRLALDRPDLVGGVMTVGGLVQPEPPGRIGPLSRLLARSAVARQVALRGFGLPGGAIAAPAVLAASFGPEPMPLAFLWRGLGAKSGTTKALAGIARDLVIVLDDMPGLAGDLPALTVPLTLMHGSEDRILDPRDQAVALAARMPRARLHLVPGGGHMLPVTRPALITGAIRDLASAGAG